MRDAQKLPGGQHGHAARQHAQRNLRQEEDGAQRDGTERDTGDEARHCALNAASGGVIPP